MRPHPTHMMSPKEGTWYGRSSEEQGSCCNAEASFGKRSLYLARRARFLQELGRRGKVIVVSISTDDNTADIMTKKLSNKLFKRHRHALLGLGRRRPTVGALTRSVRFR